ncbi:MAG: hypothetical protein QOG10_3193 [Kribbellaceae bacterium]|nr:hypothetical protein [Kribbellaceae bacterium]
MRLILLGSAYFAWGFELAGYGTGPRRTRPEIGPALSSPDCALS